MNRHTRVNVVDIAERWVMLEKKLNDRVRSTLCCGMQGSSPRLILYSGKPGRLCHAQQDFRKTCVTGLGSNMEGCISRGSLMKEVGAARQKNGQESGNLVIFDGPCGNVQGVLAAPSWLRRAASVFSDKLRGRLELTPLNGFLEGGPPK